MSKLPSGWITTPIAAFTIDCSQRTHGETEEFKYIDIGSINRETKRIEAPQELIGKNAPSRARKPVCTGDVLVSMTRPNLNAVALVPDKLDGQIASTGFDVLRASCIDPRWLYYVVRSSAFVEAMSQLVQGALYPAVRSKDVRGFEAPFAPLNEQKRIANKFDAVLDRVDACRDRLDRIPVILKRFRQAVLAVAISGGLTEDWREENPSYIPWKCVQLDQIGSARLGKMLDKSKNIGEETPYLRNIKVRWFNYDLSDIQMIRVTPEDKEKLAIKPGDVLICEGGEPGRCAVWEESESGYVYQKALHRVRLNDSCSPKWLCYSLKRAADSEQLSAYFTGTTIKHFTGVALKSWKLNLPSREEQTEIVRRVESLFAYADHLEARYTAARAQVEKLTPALLAKAFRGELVPQDPSDEPAGELLTRIAAARETTATIRARKPSIRKTIRAPRENAAMTKSRQDDDLKDKP